MVENVPEDVVDIQMNTLKPYRGKIFKTYKAPISTFPLFPSRLFQYISYLWSTVKTNLMTQKEPMYPKALTVRKQTDVR